MVEHKRPRAGDATGGEHGVVLEGDQVEIVRIGLPTGRYQGTGPIAERTSGASRPSGDAVIGTSGGLSGRAVLVGAITARVADAQGPASWPWPTFVAGAIPAGLDSAVTEMAVVIPVQWRIGAPSKQLCESNAYGAPGAAAFRDGAASVALGLLVHLFVSLSAAASSTAAAMRSVQPLARPVRGRLAYGLVVFIAMVLVVLSLWRIGWRPPKDAAGLALSIAAHMVAFGSLAVVSTLQIRMARLARHSLRRPTIAARGEYP